MHWTTKTPHFEVLVSNLILTAEPGIWQTYFKVPDHESEVRSWVWEDATKLFEDRSGDDGTISLDISTSPPLPPLFGAVYGGLKGRSKLFWGFSGPLNRVGILPGPDSLILGCYSALGVFRMCSYLNSRLIKMPRPVLSANSGALKVPLPSGNTPEVCKQLYLVLFWWYPISTYYIHSTCSWYSGDPIPGIECLYIY